MESVKTMQPLDRTGYQPNYQVVSEVELRFGCDWSVDALDQFIEGSVEMTFGDEATQGRVSQKIFSDLFKPSLITKEFLESKLCGERLDSEYEGILEIFIQQKEYWMDLAPDVKSLLSTMIIQKNIGCPEHLQQAH